MKLYNGEILKKARKSKELTQDEVSEILGIGRRQISQMENGIFDGGIKYFLKYLSLLNLKLDITENFSGWSEGFERGYKDGLESLNKQTETLDSLRLKKLRLRMPKKNCVYLQIQHPNIKSI